MYIEIISGEVLIIVPFWFLWTKNPVRDFWFTKQSKANFGENFILVSTKETHTGLNLLKKRRGNTCL